MNWFCFFEDRPPQRAHRISCAGGQDWTQNLHRRAMAAGMLIHYE